MFVRDPNSWKDVNIFCYDADGRQMSPSNTMPIRVISSQVLLLHVSMNLMARIKIIELLLVFVE